MKKLVLLTVALILCSCSDEFKAKRFTQKIEKDGYSTVYQDIGDNGVYVYYRNKSYTYYKYNLKAKSTSIVLRINEEDFLYDGNNSKSSRVVYLKDKDKVLCYDLRTKEEVCLNKNERADYELIFSKGRHFIFCDYRMNTDCNERLVHFDAQQNTLKFVTFNEVDSKYSKEYCPTCIYGNGRDFLIILRPGTEAKDLNSLPDYLYSHSLGYAQQPKLLCEAQDTWCDESATHVSAETDDVVLVYDLHGTKVKEFATVYAWPRKRGLTSGNLVAFSQENKVLCYIANDDGEFISSVYFYYYDGHTGEEVKINKFTNHKGNQLTFSMGHQARKDIKVARDGTGITFYGETDWPSENTLFFFSFEDRSMHIIDRGYRVEFIRDRFKVTHHNDTESWYNTNGQQVDARTWVDDWADDWTDSFYEAGAQLGALFNALSE